MTAKVSRSVRVHLAMKDGPIPKSIKKSVSEVVGKSNIVFVDEMATADVVVFSEVRDVERGYDKEKSYVFMRVAGAVPRLPEGCAVIQCTEIVAGLIKVIGNVSKKLQPIADEPEAKKAVSLRSDAKRILVIEDTPKHQASARAGLAGHKLTVVTGYEEAMKILGDEKFDIVLTDLQMPMSSRTLGSDAFKLGQLVPYGLLLKDEAAHQGAKYVAVVTDLNHHADWVSAAFDHFGYPIHIEGAKVLMMHSPMNSDGSKDWATVLNRLMKD